MCHFLVFHSEVHLLFYYIVSQYYEKFLQHVVVFLFTGMGRQLSLDDGHLSISFFQTIYEYSGDSCEIVTCLHKKHYHLFPAFPLLSGFPYQAFISHGSSDLLRGFCERSYLISFGNPSRHYRSDLPHAPAAGLLRN